MKTFKMFRGFFFEWSRSSKITQNVISWQTDEIRDQNQGIQLMLTYLRVFN